ncbi:MAG: hypothetical protein ACRESZ_07980, partial [Methylococcales bacterium]
MSQQPSMRIVIGAPVTDSDFYPRDKIVNKLLRGLEIEHVLFLAPRRTGKTSVLLNLRNKAPAQAVFIDLEGFDHPALWMKAMVKKLSEIQDGAF